MRQSTPGVVQALSQSSLISTYDLSLISVLGWDLGSTTLLSVLQIDEAVLGEPAPFSMVPDCEEFETLRNSLVTALTGPESGPESATRNSTLDRLLTNLNCASVTIKEMPSTTEIDDELYCSFTDNTVRICSLKLLSALIRDMCQPEAA